MTESNDMGSRAATLSGEVISNINPRPVLILSGVRADVIEYGFRTGSTILPSLQLMYDYDGIRVPADRATLFKAKVDGRPVTLQRDTWIEEGFRRKLNEAAEGFRDPELFRKDARCSQVPSHAIVLWPFNHLKPLEPGGGGYRAAFFEQRVLPELIKEGWISERRASWPLNIIEPQFRFLARASEHEVGTFSVEPLIDVDGTELPLRPILMQLIRQLPDDWMEPSFDLDGHLAGKKLLIAVPDGISGLPVTPLIPFLKVFSEIGNDQHVGEAVKISRIRESLEEAGIQFLGGENVLALGSKLRELYSEVPFEGSFSGFVGELRSYQTTGARWLKVLSETGYGALLADDMGLGKTFQSMAHLSDLYATTPGRRPSLLVVTSSTLTMWERELALHAPSLRVMVYHGPSRDWRFRGLENHQILLTTYNMLMRDERYLKKLEFDTVLIDECQAAKNRANQVTKTLRTIKSRHRIALSGTPIENHLGEFWTIMDWLNRDILGDHKSFNAKFRKPIEKLGDMEQMRLLKLRTSPFMLRRTKDQVESELPAKTIVTEYIKMSEGQKTIYESLRLLADADVRRTLQQKGIQKAQFSILSALMKLRQVCCDPRLSKLQSAGIAESAKLEFLMEMLEELVAEGRRVLIFSQFVEMLKITEGELRERGWTYEILTGATTNRQEKVDRFQSGDVPVFLLSLKAGGVGLTLTAADTVILYDPWWNPAAERQAMDRAHRIGQDKPVFVYRLIMEGTIESRVEAIQEGKRSITDALLDAESGGIFKMDEDQLLSLFEPILD